MELTLGDSKTGRLALKKFNIEPSALSQTFNVAGNDSSWKTRVRTFCREQQLHLEHLVAEMVRITSPHLGESRRKREANRICSAFDNKRNPLVPEPLRRLVAFLTSLVKANKPLPYATA